MASGSKCLFVDIYRGQRPRPCAKCLARERPFGGYCYETKSHFEWWAAEHPKGVSFFRCFPKATGLPKTPQARAAYIKREYADEMKSIREKIEHEFRDRPKRGKIWLLAAANGMFSRFPRPEEITRYRPATACEVSAWLAGHKIEFLAMKYGEEMIAELENYV